MSVDYAKIAALHGGRIAPPPDIDYAALALEFEGVPERQVPSAALGLPNVNGPVFDAAKRFGSAIASDLNPVSILGGLAGAVAHPIDTAKGLIDAQSLQAVQAYDAFRGGNYTEAINRVGAAGMPVIGPQAQGIVDEMRETGDIASGLGHIAAVPIGAMLAGGSPSVIKGSLRPITRGIKAGGTFGKEAVRESLQTYLNTDAGMLKSAIKGTAKVADSRVIAKGESSAPPMGGKGPKWTRSEIEAGQRAAKAERMAQRGVKPIPPSKLTPDLPPEKIVTMRETAAAKDASKPSQTVADEFKARAERQKQHIADSYANKAAQEAKNVANAENLEAQLRASIKPKALGNRVYAPPPGPSAPRSVLAEYYNISPDVKMANGAVGIHPELGLPMNAEGKVLVRNVHDFNQNPGMRPDGDVVWRDPERVFGKNPSIVQMKEILEARSKGTTSMGELGDKVKAAFPDTAARAEIQSKLKPKYSPTAAKDSREFERYMRERVSDDPIQSKLKRGDVVEAKPAFPGQQGRAGATKARFSMVAERGVRKWIKSGDTEARMVNRLKQLFKMSEDDAIKLIQSVKE